MCSLTLMKAKVSLLSVQEEFKILEKMKSVGNTLISILSMTKVAFGLCRPSSNEVETIYLGVLLISQMKG